jgi:hypothetical protein
MEWFRQIQFISGVPMPDEIADRLGTTVNGMWADPARSEGTIAEAHAKGQRVLFSVPMVALTPNVYEHEDTSHLLDEVCLDVDGNKAECGWYYWEGKPVYAVCIYSEPFRRYLLELCRLGIENGADVVNLDEVMTNIGLMNLGHQGSGFCHACLDRFRASHAGVEAGDDDLRRRLKDDAALFASYQRFQEREAFSVVGEFIQDLREFARAMNPDFAITANVAYLGNNVASLGDLWGPMWGEHVDFVMMENDYRVEPDDRHAILPRGKFTAWYRLGSAVSRGAPTWICPSIMVPKQLEHDERIQYYLLMFLEAYANHGRWGYYWAPGVSVEARLKATVPPQLGDWIRFINERRDYYERATSLNDLAIVYLDSSVSREPDAHNKYLGLTQALAETGYQFDVVYSGDGNYADDALDPARLTGYRALLIPEAAHLTPTQTDALTTYALETGGELVAYSPNQLGGALAREEHGEPLRAYRRDYRSQDRDRIVASVDRYRSSQLRTSDPSVNVIRYGLGEEVVLHLLNYAYDAAEDRIAPSSDLRLTISWERASEPDVTLHGLEGERKLDRRHENGELVIEIPELREYGLVVAR